MHKIQNYILQYHRGEQLDLCISGVLPPIQHFSNDVCPSVMQNELFACVLRAPRRLPPSGFRGAPRANTLSMRVRSYHDQLHGPIRFPQHLFSVHDNGRQRSDKGPQHTFLPLRWPECTSSRLRVEEYDRPVTQPIATPEPSSRTIPTLDRTLVARWSPERVATPGSRRSCPG